MVSDTLSKIKIKAQKVYPLYEQKVYRRLKSSQDLFFSEGRLPNRQVLSLRLIYKFSPI